MGALGGLAQGILAGRELRMRLQQAADQHLQAQQLLQQHNQDAAMKMITDRMNLEMMGARPVDNGTVEDAGDKLAAIDGGSFSSGG